MNENKSPQDFLNEIFEKTQEPAPPPPQPRLASPGNDPPPTPPPDEPEQNNKTDAGAKLLPWLCLALGAVLLVMSFSMFQLVRVNSRLEQLQQAVDGIQAIDSLQSEKKTLQQSNDVLNRQLNEVKMERDSLQLANNFQSNLLGDAQNCSITQNALCHLERFVDARDWLMAGTMVEQYDWRFNSNNVTFLVISVVPLPSQAERYLELREMVVEQDAVIVDEVFRHRWSELEDSDDSRAYYEQPRLQDDGRFQEQDRQTADLFAAVLAWYPTQPESTAFLMAQNFPDAGSQDRLNSGAFQPYTVELFQQIKADLTALGLLTEEDGTLTAVGSALASELIPLE